MPVHTYLCQSCGARFTMEESLFARPLKRCPACSRGAVRRIPQLPAIVFKGSGRYSSAHRPASGPDNAPGPKEDWAGHPAGDQGRS